MNIKDKKMKVALVLLGLLVVCGLAGVLAVSLPVGQLR